MSQAPEELDLLLPNPSEVEQLRRALVKLSVAAGGQHQMLDKALERLRTNLKAGGDSFAVQKDVDAITDVLREIGDEIDRARRQVHRLTVEELVTAFLKHPLPLSVQQHLQQLSPLHTDAPALVNALAGALNNEERPSFWARLRGKKAPPPAVSPLATPAATPEEDAPSVPSNHDLSAPLLRLLDQLELPEEAAEALRSLREDISNLADPSGLPPLFEEVSALILDAAQLEQQQFERFLRGVNERLAQVQNALVNGQARAQASDDEASALHDAMREQVAGLREGVARADSFETLQAQVGAQLDGLLASVGKLQANQAQRARNRSDDVLVLREQLRATEDEASRLRESLTEQRQRAQTDALTGLANRHAWHDRIHLEYNRWKRYAHRLALIVADIDHFKKVNDTHGHLTGDAVLRRVAQTLSDNIRDVDYVARFGGEEFVLLMPETGLVDATKAINKLRQRIAMDTWLHEGIEMNVTVSFGVAEFEKGDSPRDVFHRADRALYRAKRRGRNQVCCERRDLPGVDVAET